MAIPRIGRLSIPRVNPNPQVKAVQNALGARLPKAPQPTAAPKPPKVQFGGPQGGRPVGTPAAPYVDPVRTVAPPRDLSGTEAPGTTAGPGPSAAVDPFTSISTAIKNPSQANPLALSSYKPESGQPDPRDATYWANLSKLLFNDQQSYAGNLRDQSVADSAYTTALGSAAHQRTLDQRTLGENAIKGNLGNSGWLDRAATEQTNSYLQNQSQNALSKSQSDQARQAARDAILQGFSVDEAALLAQSVATYGSNAQKEGQSGSPDPTGDGTPTAPAPGTSPWSGAPARTQKLHDKPKKGKK